MKFQITTKDKYGRVTATHFAEYDTQAEADEFAERMVKGYSELMPNRNVSYCVYPVIEEKPSVINRIWCTDGENGQYSIMLKDQDEDESGDLALVNQFKTLSNKEAKKVAVLMATAPELLKACEDLIKGKDRGVEIYDGLVINGKSNASNARIDN